MPDLRGPPFAPIHDADDHGQPVNPDCERCGNTGKLRGGQHCPSCTHVIEWVRTPSSRARLNVMHVVKCSCGWRHSETSRQNALGRAAKMRGAVTKHLGGLEK